MPRQFQPVHLGHLYIGEQDVDGMGAHIFQRRFPVGRLGNLQRKLVLFNEERNSLTFNGFIINN